MGTRILMSTSEFEESAARLGPCELVRGEVVPLSPGGFAHSQIMINVGTLLKNWCRGSKSGRVAGGEIGIVISEDPATIRAANVAYFSYRRLPANIKPEGFTSAAPDLVVEILGKGQGWRQVMEKNAEYLNKGVDRVWVVDPRTQRVHIFQPEAEPQALGCGQVLCDESILPGFSCKVDELFAD